MVHLGDSQPYPGTGEARMKPLAAPSTPPLPLSPADCSGGWNGDNNSRPILRMLVQVHDQPNGYIHKYILFVAGYLL